MTNVLARSDLDKLSTQPLHSVLYVSRTTELFAPEDLGPMLLVSRAKNWIRNLTGLLLVENGRFMHYLEGPADAVRERMVSIRTDARHTHLSLLAEKEPTERLFPHWTMASAPLAEVEDAAPGLRLVFADPESTPDADTAATALHAVADWFATQRDHHMPDDSAPAGGVIS